MPRDDRLSRLFVLSGVVPTGLFVAVHLVATATAMSGSSRFDRAFAHHLATTIALVVLVLVPLTFHAVYGAFLAVARPRELALPSWLPRLRRTASLGTLAFVVAHVVELPARVWTGQTNAGSLFDVVSAHLSSTWHGVPVVAIAYAAGVAATLLHVGLSFWAALPALGYVLVNRARTVLLVSLVGGGVLLFGLGWDTIVFLATGARLLWVNPPAFVPEGPPAVPCAGASNGPSSTK
jgi:succinate dehydrogenase / fumarate reductase cytochrome b subunit